MFCDELTWKRKKDSNLKEQDKIKLHVTAGSDASGLALYPPQVFGKNGELVTLGDASFGIVLKLSNKKRRVVVIGRKNHPPVERLSREEF
tara:strand:- start:4891 stop:5160 length:270 start_codon:yes stop_codon:yes gene_type:complete